MGVRHLLVLGVAATAAGVLGAGQTASAATVTPAAYNSPEVNAAFSGSGSPQNAGGATWTYSNLNPSAFQSMWWGPTTLGLGFNGVADALTFDSFSASTAKWLGTSQIQVSNGFGYSSQSVQTELLLTLQSPTGATFSASPAGANNGADYQITGSNFSVNIQFLARDLGSNGAFVDATTYFNSRSTPPSDPQHPLLQSSFGASFFIEAKPADAASTPLPSAALGGVALLGGAFTSRSRRRARE